MCFKKRTCHLMLTQGLLRARPVTEVSHCTFEIQTWLLGDFFGLGLLLNVLSELCYKKRMTTKLCLMYFVFKSFYT